MRSEVTFYVFRHGETDWNRQGRFQGHIDIPLNEIGREQARRLASLLSNKNLDVIISSDLSRARETADIISTELSIPVLVDMQLREAHLGAVQGLTLSEIEDRLGHDIVRRWRSQNPTDADVAYPGGESGVDVITRSFQALKRHASGEHQNIGISTHGGVIRRVISQILPHGSKPVPIPNGVLYILKYRGQNHEWVLANFV